MSKDAGVPAFPELHWNEEGWNRQYGMTLRDYFAAKIAAAIFAGNALGQVAGQAAKRGVSEADCIAMCAYEQADAMLKERAK